MSEHHPRAMTLDESSALVGHYRWIERSLHGLLGHWVCEVPLPSVALMLDAQSMRHAWHAQLWTDRLPVLAGVDGDALTTPSAGAEAAVELLKGEGEEGAVGVLPRLAGLYRVVLPRLIATYEHHLQLANGAADAPVMRALTLVGRDDLEDWRAGERLVQELMAGPHDVAAVYGFLQELESAVVATGLDLGLVEFPEIGPAE